MDITLDKIDIIRDRTGVSYKEAREALTFANGNVVDALINIEESGDKKWTETMSVKGNEAMDKLKTLVKSGNVNRIRIKKDNGVILDIPVTAGAISAVVMPQITAIGTAVALMTKCTIEVERQNKGTVNVNNVINNAVGNAADKVRDFAEEVKNTTQNMSSNNVVDDCCSKIDTDMP
ncbi:MAG: DUF4342 domain-containing protein [Lutispora sp.]|nr:DUF4342 domain-containing protein [Lutispora sp.]MDD4833323.1 DUF4342 domain-containing protein [Lutispora sp.]